MADVSATDTNSHEEKVAAPQDGISLIDRAIRDISGRDLVSTAEMTDLLLDIRLYLMREEVVTTDNNL